MARSRSNADGHEMDRRLLQNQEIDSVASAARDERVRALYSSGVRRIGKTTFLKQHLIPALKTHGAIVVYVDLWSDISVVPSVLLQRAVRSKLGKPDGVTLAERLLKSSSRHARTWCSLSMRSNNASPARMACR